MNKIIVTAAGPNMRPVLDEFSLPTFTRYAENYNYEVYAHSLTGDSLARKDSAARTARWYKIRLIRQMLEQYDVVLWLDADVMIRRFDEDIADHLLPDQFQGLVLHCVPAENRINPNTGVWLLRKAQITTEYLDTIEKIGLPEGRWADQGAVLRALDWENGDSQYHGAGFPKRSNRFYTGTSWLPISWNQPYCENRPNPQAYVGRPVVERPHAVHFMSMTIEERIRNMGNTIPNGSLCRS